MNENLEKEYYEKAYCECCKAVAYVYLKLARRIYYVLIKKYPQTLKNRAVDDIIV